MRSNQFDSSSCLELTPVYDGSSTPPQQHEGFAGHGEYILATAVEEGERSVAATDTRKIESWIMRALQRIKATRK